MEETGIEMKIFSQSHDQKIIDGLRERIDEINHKLADGHMGYEFMKKQTSEAKGTVNKKSHEEDLKDFKAEIDKLEETKRKVKMYIKMGEKKIAAESKKGGRRTRKKRGKGGVMSAMRNKEARKQQRKTVLIKAHDAFKKLYQKAEKEALQKVKTKINPILSNKKYSLQARQDKILDILEKYPNLKLIMGRNGFDVKFQPSEEELKKMLAIARANVFNPNEGYYPYPRSQLEETTKLFKPTDPIKEFPYARVNKSGGKRTRRRKSKRKKRRTRRAGMLQSKTPGQKGLTEREIKLRKKARLKALAKANERLKARIVADRDIAKSFENLRVSPVQTKDDLLSSMKSFEERMSPISFSSKKSTGGKKTRKKRRRKRRR